MVFIDLVSCIYVVITFVYVVFIISSLARLNNSLVNGKWVMRPNMLEVHCHVWGWGLIPQSICQMGIYP